MKIQLNIGCFGENITVDGFPIEEMSIEGISNICTYLVDCAKDKTQLIEIVRMLMTEVAEYIPDEEPCSDCGNWGETYTIEI